jgi:hypothetical protein
MFSPSDIYFRSTVIVPTADTVIANSLLQWDKSDDVTIN